MVISQRDHLMVVADHWMDKLIPDASGKDNVPTNTCAQNLISKTNGAHMESANGTPIGNTKPEHEDYVSGMLYDMLQKEAVSLRKACNERDQTLKDKDDAIEMLAKKVNTLNKAMEVEAKKMRREVAAIRVSKDHDQRMRCISTPRGAVNSSHLTSARKARNP
nr:microtubule-associated protein 70-2 [Quercus suber]